MITNVNLSWCLGVLLVLCSCAHVERVGFDNTTHTVRYCGNRHADELDVKAEARKACSTARRLEVLRCMREQIGAKADTYNFGAGASFTNIDATYGVCCDFQCGG